MAYIDKDTAYDNYFSKHFHKEPQCVNCGKDIKSYEEFGYVKTKRKTELFICEACVKKGRMAL